VLSAFTSPPCIFASSCQRQADPVPSWVRLFAPLDAVKAVEDAGQLGRSDAGPRVDDLENPRSRRGAQADRDALEGELERVGDWLRTIFSHISRST
jgi:hypothetical protein